MSATEPTADSLNARNIWFLHISSSTLAPSPWILPINGFCPAPPVLMQHSGTPDVTDIPLDILEVIFKSLAPNDLAIFCRVNKSVSALAHEELYRVLRPNRRNVMPLCLKLCDEPALAHRVRCFILNDVVHMFLGIIAETLTKLPRLQTLILFIGNMSGWILPRGNACPFLLESFSSSFSFDDTLAAFLLPQTNLRHLGVSHPDLYYAANNIQPQMFPRLVSVSAPMFLVQGIVPNRPVRNITAYHAGDNPPLISCLSRSTSPAGIRRLMLNFSYLRTVGCEQLAQCAPKLDTFTVDADGVKPDDCEMLEEMTEWIEEYLSYARSLECLFVRFYPLLSTTPCPELDFSDMITSIFAASQNLKHVIITFFGFKTKYVCKQVPGHDWYIVND